LSNFTRDNLLTDRGEWLFAEMAQLFKNVYENHWHRIQKFAFSNQGYNFSYADFAGLNRI